MVALPLCCMFWAVTDSTSFRKKKDKIKFGERNRTGWILQILKNNLKLLDILMLIAERFFFLRNAWIGDYYYTTNNERIFLT